MFKNITQLLIVLAIIVASIFVWEKIKNFNLFSSVTTTTHNMVLKEISTLGKLELAKFAFRDVVEQEIDVQYLPNPKALLVVQGEAIGCLDLTKVTTDDIATKGDTIIVHLPEPELCSYKIDHEKTKIHSTEFAFMNEQELLNNAYRKAEKQIQESALEMGILTQTKKNAELILMPLLEKISGKKVLLQYPMTAILRQPK
jgi:hypothetical protein